MVWIWADIFHTRTNLVSSFFFLLPVGKRVDGGRQRNEATWGGISQYALSPTGYTLSEYASVNLIRKLRELDKSTTKKEK